ncbi:MAG: sulfite exporter TauE/SafE family protein [Acidimicrobiia bacterium]|nr:sulfite exporter TauE/SafE family protein [Acidimicrobiia bacterium]MBT8251164.1 sulfite exporter TauE/SafE family protein [Acidimicrobiia bacterium]NNC43083.1 sulfite exporter TauE/SafE family protein [Acidimicrobiia bacterium]NND12777.1 sulfite exporter TauE/SafE family protein [Acidimicrobiia bacterium]NNL29328.1 sulfite exporter TauE/SafE family protein [Acidimicrobiia bacterium]
MNELGLILVGLLTGVLASLLGIGGGIVIVPALVALFGFEQLPAQATSLAVILPTAIVGTATNHRLGRIDVRLVSGLFLGALVGGFLGAQVAIGLDPLILRRLFAALLVVAAVRLYRKTELSGTAETGEIGGDG